LKVSWHDVHLVGEVQHRLEPLSPRKSPIVGQLLYVLLHPVGFVNAQILQNTIDFTAKGVSIEGQRVLEDAGQPHEVIVEVILRLDFLSQPRDLDGVIKVSDLDPGIAAFP
jgi:hypothetical protein